MMDTRLWWVDYAKGIGIILVVFGHVVGGADFGTQKILPVFLVSRDIVYHFHMPLFFFLSGLFVHGSFMKRSALGFIGDKFRLLAYPYFIWSVLQGGILMMMSHYSSLRYDLSDVLAIWYKPLQHFWFLYVLMLMYALYAVLQSINGSWLPVIIGASGILYFYPIASPIAGLDYFSANLVFFVAGIMYQKYAADAAVDRTVSLTSVGLVCGLFVACELFARFIWPGKTVLLLTAAAGIGMIGFTSQYLVTTNVFPLLRMIGYYSLPIYLVHGLSGSGLRIILYDILRMRNGSIIIIVSSLMGVAVPIVVYKLSMKYFPYLFEMRRQSDDAKFNF